MNRLPCPQWCVTDHRAEDAAREYPLDDFDREHFSGDVKIPVRGCGGGDSDRTVSVSLTMTEDDHGVCAPVGVWLSAGGEELSPENAVTFAVAILNAAAIAAGGRLDRLVSAELDRLCGGGEAA